MDRWEALLLCLCLVHLFACPFTKVEESFSMQAVYDIVTGKPLRFYDHVLFKGVVPRSFVPPLFVAMLTFPILFVARVVEICVGMDWLGAARAFLKLTGTNLVGGKDESYYYFGNGFRMSSLTAHSGDVEVNEWGEKVFSAEDLAVYLFGALLTAQTAARCVIALLVWHALRQFKRAIQRKYGQRVAMWFTVMLCSQFHLIFYSSRALGNVFALVLVLHACTAYVQNNTKWFVYLMAVCSVVVRFEIVFLFMCIYVSDMLLQGGVLSSRHQLTNVVWWGLTGFAFGVVLTVSVDSYFWKLVNHHIDPFVNLGYMLNINFYPDGSILNRYVMHLWHAMPEWAWWPELEVFIFNVVLNKSSEWGTEPGLWYFTSALPRGMMGSFILLPIGLLMSTVGVLIKKAYANRTRSGRSMYNKEVQGVLELGMLLFVTLLSTLPHKELRFIIYSFAPFTLCSAVLMDWACSRLDRKSNIASKSGELRETSDTISSLKRLCTLFMVAVCGVFLLLSFVASFAFLSASSLNYPGGYALARIHMMYDGIGLCKTTSPCSVYICNLAAQTGVTRFGEVQNVWWQKKFVEEKAWMYSKDSLLNADQCKLTTFLILESESVLETQALKTHFVEFRVKGFDRVNFRLVKYIVTDLLLRGRLRLLVRLLTGWELNQVSKDDRLEVISALSSTMDTPRKSPGIRLIGDIFMVKNRLTVMTSRLWRSQHTVSIDNPKKFYEQY
eukprot:Nk52_evm8s553 gene=Nk52_evmTU8s553